MGGRSVFGGCILLVLSCAALLAGCGGDSSHPRAAASPATAPTPEPAAEPPPKPQDGVSNRMVPNPWSEPSASSVGRHPGAKVDRVIVRQLKKGTGPMVRPGDAVMMDYIEANYTTGNKFMRAWRGDPWPTAEVTLTPAAVMRGLIIGMRGMRVGGRRQIIVPRRLSDIHDSDRAGNSYREIVYYDVVLRTILVRG
jgi:hypothetical protein